MRKIFKGLTARLASQNAGEIPCPDSQAFDIAGAGTFSLIIPVFPCKFPAFAVRRMPETAQHIFLETGYATTILPRGDGYVPLLTRSRTA